jgi:hypothetical protein
MPDAELWAAEIGLFVVVAVLLVVLLIDGAYQALAGQPSRIGLERLWLHRVPATELDCVRQGASKILQATAMLLIEAPSVFIVIRTTADLTGMIAPPFGRLPVVLEALMFGAIFGSLFLALILVGFAYAVGVRVSYRRVEREIPAN